MYRDLKFCIGDSVRLAEWPVRCIFVEDIGVHSFWGYVIERKSGRVIDGPFSYPLDQAWEKILTVDDVLATM